MVCDFRRPINCYTDSKRYRTMVILHTIDLAFFIIRLSLVSNDISKNEPTVMGLLVSMLIFDLIAYVPMIICDILYIIMRLCVQPLVTEKHSYQRLWHFSTMTCIRTNYHKNRPQAILLTRLVFLMIFFVFKFISFALGAWCSARNKAYCTAYTVIAAFALVSSVFLLVVEFVHFFRLWTYNPTDTRNENKTNKVFVSPSETKVQRTHRRHLRFIHYSLLNDQNVADFRGSRCEKGAECPSRSLHHNLFYHSIETPQSIESKLNDEKFNKSFIAYYQTNKASALKIAQTGFPVGAHSGDGAKEHLHLDQKIVFKPSVDSNSAEEATFCVRLHLGRVLILNVVSSKDIYENFAKGEGVHDTLYSRNQEELHIRMTGQIEKWIISFNDKVQVNDDLDGKFYAPCI